MQHASRAALTAVHVVVPAHDEEERVGACLVSLAAARSALRAARPDLDVGLLLVLDRCTDRTAEVAARLGVPVLAVEAGSVGAARRAGVAAVAARAAADGHDTAGTLVACTDADCEVPPTWLLDHVALAAGADLVLGEVRLGAPGGPDGIGAAAAAEWARRHRPGAGSLHGANLSSRLDAHLAAGGFPAVAEHEDLLLVRAMRAAGARVVGGTVVTTSDRRHGRVPGGFAGYLRRLAEEVEQVEPAPGGAEQRRA